MLASKTVMRARPDAIRKLSKLLWAANAPRRNMRAAAAGQPEQARQPEQPQEQGLTKPQEYAERKRSLARFTDDDFPALMPLAPLRMSSLMSEMQREMNSLMNSFFPGDFTRPLSLLERMPLAAPSLGLAEVDKFLSVDIQEHDKDYTISAEVPGFSKEEIKVRISPDGVMTITGEHRDKPVQEGAKEGGKAVIRPLVKRFASFTRSFRLPDDVQHDNVKATVKNGMLVVMVPKSEQRQAQFKEVPLE